MNTQLSTALSSRTAWAIAVSLLAAAAAKRHIIIDGDTQSLIVDLALQAVSWIAAATAIYRHVILKIAAAATLALLLQTGCSPFNFRGGACVDTNGWHFEIAPFSIQLQPTTLPSYPTTNSQPVPSAQQPTPPLLHFAQTTP